MNPKESSTASLHSVLYAKPLYTFHSYYSQLEGCHPPSEGILFQPHPASSPPVKIHPKLTRMAQTQRGEGDLLVFTADTKSQHNIKL